MMVDFPRYEYKDKDKKEVKKDTTKSLKMTAENSNELFNSLKKMK